MRTLALMSLLFLASGALAQVPTSVPYRALLTQSDGSPYEGEVTLQAALYPCAAEGCEASWTSAELTLDVREGLVSFVLDEAGGGAAAEVLSDGGAYWLQISVLSEESWEAMLPRQAVLSVPYAIAAHQADDALRLGGLDAADFALASDLEGYLTLEALTDLGYATQAELASYATLEALANAGYLTEAALADAGYLTSEALSALVTTEGLSEALEGYATTASLEGYLTSEALEGYLTSEALDDYVTIEGLSEALGGYATGASLEGLVGGVALTATLAD